MAPEDEQAAGARLARAAVLSGVVVLVSVLAHVAGGGQAPSTTAVLAGWALLVPLLSRLTARRLELPLVLGLLGAGQLLAHAGMVLAVLATAPGAASARVPAVRAGEHASHEAAEHALAAAADAAALDGAAASSVDAVSAGLHGGTAMLAAHLLAAAAVGLWLVAGERAVLHLVRLAVAAVRRSCEELVATLVALLGTVVPEVAVPGLLGTQGTSTTRLETRALGPSSRRRGPPARGR